jgi:hypothetical protein
VHIAGERLFVDFAGHAMEVTSSPRQPRVHTNQRWRSVCKRQRWSARRNGKKVVESRTAAIG